MSAEHRIALVSSTLSSPCWSELCTQEHGAVIASLLEVITLRPPTSGLGTSHAHLLETHWIRPRANEQCTNASILFLISHFNLANLKSIKTFQTELYSKNLNHPKNTITFYKDLCFALEEAHEWMTMIVCRTQHMEHHRQPCGHRVRAGSYCWLRPAWRGGQRRYGERWHVSRYVIDIWHSIEPAVQYF